MAKKQAKPMKKDDEKKLYAFLGVFLTVIGFIIALVTKKDDKYVMFYAKQGLVLFFGWIIAGFAAMVLWVVPAFGHFISGLIYLLVFILWIIGIIYSLSGEMKKIPIVGDLAEKIKI
jgi:uncharacterized membrane protein